jgi:DNA-binding SARP family transcriptional activator
MNTTGQGVVVMSMIKFYLLGEPRIMIGNKDVTKHISSKGIGILAYLITNKDEQKISRERLSSMFWNDSLRESAKYNLRYTLWSIKKVMKENGINEEIIISKDKDTCMVNKEIQLWSDVETLCSIAQEIESNIEERALQFLEIYKGNFLENISLNGNPELDDWIIYEKEYFQRKYFNGVLNLGNLFSAKSDYKKSIECLEKLLYINPLEEDIHRELMEYYYLDGNRVAAIKQYEKCVSILRNELNISPMEATIKLYEKIKGGRDYEVNDNKNNKGSKDRIDHKEHSKKYPEFFILTEFVEALVKNNPNIIHKVNKVYLYELSKLLPEVDVEYCNKISYLSPEIEKLRIFKSVSQVIKALDKSATFKFHLFCKIDNISLELFSFLSARHVGVRIWIQDNELLIQVN